MKLYQTHKKQFHALVFTFLLIILSVFPVLFTHAQTATDLQNKINQKDSDIAQLEKEIATYQTQLDSIGEQKNSLSSAIKELDITKKKLQADISVTQKKIDKTNLTIQGLSTDINIKQNSINNNADAIALEIRHINEFENVSVLQTILSEDDFTAMWNDIDNIITLEQTFKQKTTELKEVKGQLEDTRKESIAAKNQLVTLRSTLSDQQKIVIQNQNEKNKLLKQTKNNEANYQKLLKDRIAERDAFEKELLDYQTQLQFALDPSKLPSSGVLSWPLTNVFITQLFGKTVDSKRLYASGSHSGVDFRASVGTPVLAMADGTVLGTGDTDLTCYGASFGKFVFIQYNNGLSSAFGHLSLIKSNVGDKVGRGEIVGYSGATGHVTGPHLHVTVYASQAVKMQSKPSAACNGRIYTMPLAPLNGYLDPLYYLPSYTANQIKVKAGVNLD